VTAAPGSSCTAIQGGLPGASDFVETFSDAEGEIPAAAIDGQHVRGPVPQRHSAASSIGGQPRSKMCVPPRQTVAPCMNASAAHWTQRSEPP
jgi:hypothetical protein